MGYTPYIAQDVRMYKEREKPEIFRTLGRNILQLMIGCVLILSIIYPLLLFFFTTDFIFFYSLIFVIVVTVPLCFTGLITCCCSALSGTCSKITHVLFMIYSVIMGLLLIALAICVAVVWMQFSNIFYWQFFIALLLPGIIFLFISTSSLVIAVIDRYRMKYFKNELKYEPVESTLVTRVKVEAAAKQKVEPKHYTQSQNEEQGKKSKKNDTKVDNDEVAILKEFELDEEFNSSVTPEPGEIDGEIVVPQHLEKAWKKYTKKNMITNPKKIHLDQFMNTTEAAKLERDHKYGTLDKTPSRSKLKSSESSRSKQSRKSDRSRKSGNMSYNTVIKGSKAERKARQKEIFMKKEAAGSAWTKFAKKEQNKGIEPSWEKFEKKVEQGLIVIKKPKNDVGKKIALFTKMKMRLGKHIDAEDLEILEAISKEYKIPLSDVKATHSRLKKQYGEELDRKQLKKCLNAAKVSKNLLASLGRLLDKNGDGTISIAEYLAGMLPLRYGSIETKLDMAFEMFDYDRSANLSKLELYRFVDTFADYDVSREEKKSMTSALFSAMDRDQDGEITVEEFKLVAKKDPNIVEIINKMGSRIQI